MASGDTGNFNVITEESLIREVPDSGDGIDGRKTSEPPQLDSSFSRQKTDRERKLGHRRVGEGGEVTYKKIQTSQIMGSIQLGIQHSVGGLASKPERDLLMQDFMQVETFNFPTMGSSFTPAHHFVEFKFKNHAPIAFRYFRDLFKIRPDIFLVSMCSSPLRELSNPGASGSIFYLTQDDEFIIKTVQHKEGEFLQKLLPGYYMNLHQNPKTLLPKFFGLFCYQHNNKNIRLVVMNNLLPSRVEMHQKYDLKGSTYKRKASKSERAKKSPTYKDLDFMEHYPEGIYLEGETYADLTKTLQRDCRVLQSFKIMDYSLLVGVHNLDIDKVREGGSESSESDIPQGIPAQNEKGERLMLFLGIIDILQSYRLKKKLEHTWKSIIHDGDTVSVHRPGFYAERFLNFMSETVFKKIPTFKNRNKSVLVATESFNKDKRTKSFRGSNVPVRKSSLSVASSSTSGFVSGTIKNVIRTPPPSVEGSTISWTEGTPSYTESSCSGDVGSISGGFSSTTKPGQQP